MKTMVKIWDKSEGKYVEDGDGEVALFNTVDEAIKWLNTPDELKKEYLESNFEYHDHFWMDKTGYDFQ